LFTPLPDPFHLSQRSPFPSHCNIFPPRVRFLSQEKKEKKEKRKAKAEPEVEDKKEMTDNKTKKEALNAKEEEPPMKIKSGATGGGFAAAPASNPPGSCEVFMGNLSWAIDEASIQDACKDCGNIIKCEWLKYRDTGKFRGCGFITFETPEAAAKAVALNGSEILGRAIKCDFSQGKAAGKGGKGGKGGDDVRPMTAKPEGCNTLFAGNLSFDIDDDQMKAFFADCGEVSSIRWLTDRDTQQFKGCGFIEFSDDAALDKAAKKNGEQLLGRSVRLDFAAPRAPKAAW
jgi:nucleolin